MKLSMLNSQMLMIGLLLFAAAASASNQEIPAGLWEIKNKMDIPGMPPEAAAKMGNMTVTHCIKPGERKWNEQRAPMDRGERKCEPVDSKMDGNTVSWKFKCVDGTLGEGTVVHNGKDAYKMKMTVNGPRGSMKMESEGKRLTETCEKPQK